MSGDQGCMGCGCAGCLPALGALFLWSVFAYVGTVILGVLLGVAVVSLAVGVVYYGLHLTMNRARTTLPTTAQPQQRQFTTTKEYPIVGRDPITTIKNWKDEDIATLPDGARVIVSDIQQTLKHAERDEEFRSFTSFFPIGTRWLARDRGSNLRVKILAVDHRWSGRQGEPETVIITFEELASGHRFHWPAEAFANRWNLDPEEDF
jgi:hypothetical protein